MKQTYFFLLFIFIIINSTYSQSEDDNIIGFFYKTSLATTLTINENYTVGNDEDEVLINPSALFINNTIGYMFDKRTSIGLNLEYDWHSQQGLHFIPAYLSFQYNIIADDDNLFIRGGYGTLLGLSNDFEEGNLYKLGIGVQLFDEDYKNASLIGLDFSRKRFGYKTLEGLSSVSIFIEFMLF